jgi:pilus assembly protein Flp/PilA
MLGLMTWLRCRFTLLRDETGASMVEYALLVVLIGILALAAVRFAGNEVGNVFNNIGENLRDATPSSTP